jgi:serine O-acetyltransferase
MRVELLFWRAAHRLLAAGFPRIARTTALLGRVIFGSHIPAETSIGSGTKVAYGGAALVIHPRAIIGRDCELHPGVTIGGRKGPGVPVIEDRVRIYSGAKVLGDVRIGADSVIGANAVVVDDLPPGTVVVAPKAVVSKRIARAHESPS